MIRRWADGSIVHTGFCIDKKVLKKGIWTTEERIEQVVTTQIEFVIPDEWLDEYLKQTPSLDCAGAMAIEEYGFQFVRAIYGSYTNIVGLPLFEVRQALTQMNFFIFNQ